jgi:hypothetical protein
MPTNTARLSATKQRELLRIVGVVNPYLFADAEGAQVYVTYRPQKTGRAYQSAAWQVVRPGYRTDPGGHWRDVGHKTFSVYRRDQKAAQLDAAKAWADAQFGVTEWAKTPFGTWMDKAFVERRLADLLARAAAGGGSR